MMRLIKFLLDIFPTLNIYRGNPVLFHFKDLAEKEVMVRRYLHAYKERRDIINDQ